MTALFRSTAPKAMAVLIKEFRFSPEDAAAVMGNAGHESGGLMKLQEIKPVVAGSRGGWGWFQWTGPRRRAFEAWAKERKLDPAGYDANLGYLIVELKGSEKAAVDKTKKAVGLQAKTEAFERSFERAGVKHYPSRLKWAQMALEAYDAVVAKGGYVPAAIAPDPQPVAAPEAGGFWAGLFAALVKVFKRKEPA